MEGEIQRNVTYKVMTCPFLPLSTRNRRIMNYSFRKADFNLIIEKDIPNNIRPI